MNRKKKALNIILKTTSAFVCFVGIAMIIFAWIHFYRDDESIIELASLYLALFISVITTVIALVVLFRNKENKDD